MQEGHLFFLCRYLKRNGQESFQDVLHSFVFKFKNRAICSRVRIFQA